MPQSFHSVLLLANIIIYCHPSYFLLDFFREKSQSLFIRRNGWLNRYFKAHSTRERQLFPPLFTHSQRQPAPRPHGRNSAWNAAQNSSIHTPDTVAAGTTPPAPRLRCEAYGLIFSVRNRPFGNCISNQTSEPTPIP